MQVLMSTRWGLLRLQWNGLIKQSLPGHRGPLALQWIWWLSKALEWWKDETFSNYCWLLTPAYWGKWVSYVPVDRYVTEVYVNGGTCEWFVLRAAELCQDLWWTMHNEVYSRAQPPAVPHTGCKSTLWSLHGRRPRGWAKQPFPRRLMLRV